MRRLSPALAAALVVTALTVPAAAQAELVEVGKADPAAKPSCPSGPCLAVSRTTGYQAKVGTDRNLMRIPENGRLVAWSIALGNPGTKQTAFFNSKLGGEARAQITVLKLRSRLRSRVVKQGEVRRLTHYFGSTVQFALNRSLRVHKGEILALTVTTWAPALAVGLGSDTSWRASRGRGKCEDTGTQTAQLALNQLAQYFCLYRTARLTYGATLVTDPKATPQGG